MTREEKLEAVENYLYNNVAELVYILEELEEKCRSKFGFTVHKNTEDFFKREFEGNPYEAVIVTNSDSYDANDEFVIYLRDLAEMVSFNRKYPPITLEVNLTEITEMIVSIWSRKHILMMSNDLYQMIRKL